MLSRHELVAMLDKLVHRSSAGDTSYIAHHRSCLDSIDDELIRLLARRLEMKLIMAADDPCDLAVNYGRAWAALGNLMPQLERCFVIKKRDLEVECDFEATKILIVARLDMTITLGRLLRLLVRHGLRGLKEFINLQNLRKGGAPK